MIRITTDIPKHLISTIITSNIDENLENEALEYKGFAVKIKRQGDLNVTARKKSIYIDLPLDIHIEKQNGLFTIEANGIILLNVTITTSISIDLHLNTKTTIDGWKWMEEPKVKVGILNIPVSPLANMVMNRIDDNITNQIDSSIAKKVNFQDLINKKLARLLDCKKISAEPELYLRAQLEGLESPGFREHTNKIELPLYLDIKNQVSTEYQVSADWNSPPFKWIDNDPLKYSQDINISLKYDRIEDIIQSKINGLVIGGKTLKVHNVEINHDKKIHIQVALTSPIESTLTISGKPVITDGKVQLEGLEVDMKTTSIIYKMTAPIIEKLIRSDIDDRFPLDLQKVIREQMRLELTKAKNIDFLNLRINANEAMLSNAQFTDNHLNATITTKEVEVVILLEHVENIDEIMS